MTITGQVIAQGGSQVIGVANVFGGLYQVNGTATPTNETLVDSMLTDAYGYYVFSNIPSGYTYVVRATRVDEKTGS